MSLDLTVNVKPLLNWNNPLEPQSIEELENEVVDALDREADRLPFDRRQQFLAGVRQHAGDILKFLDQMDREGATKIHVHNTALMLFSELRAIGERLASATDLNDQQFSREMSTYEPFKKFQLNLRELVPAQENPVPSFMDLMARAQKANAEMNIRQNMAIAQMIAVPVNAATDLAIEGVKGWCHSNPANEAMCQAVEWGAKKLGQAATAQFQETFPVTAKSIQNFFSKEHHALAHELNHQFGTPVEEGKQYASNSLVATMTLLPVPPVVKFAGRLVPQAAKTSFAGRSGFIVGALQQTGSYERARIFYQEIADRVFAFNVTSLKIGDVEIGASLNALKTIKATVLELNAKEVLVQWGNAQGRDLLAVQKWLDPVGLRPQLLNAAQNIQTFKLPHQFLKDDFGGVRLPSKASKKVMTSSVYSPVKKSPVLKFLKEDAGSVKLPLDRDFFIKLFEDIEYQITKGGKGSHLKMTKPDSPMVIIPIDSELGRGTAKNLIRTYEEALSKQARALPLEPKAAVKVKPHWNYEKPMAERINLSTGYLESGAAFVAPKEFVGVIQRDLCVIRYHTSLHLDKPHKHRTWMPLAESSKHDTMRALIDSLANPISPEALTHVSFARIPAGEVVRFMHGKTKPRIDLMTNEVQKGGAVQYRFFDFDAAWIKQTREFPK